MYHGQVSLTCCVQTLLVQQLSDLIDKCIQVTEINFPILFMVCQLYPYIHDKEDASSVENI